MISEMVVAKKAAERLAEMGVKAVETAGSMGELQVETAGSMGELQVETAGSMGELQVETAGSMGELQVETAGSMGELQVETAGSMGEVGFMGNNENSHVYQKYMREVKQHRENAMRYEREANALERKIKAGTEPKSSMKRVEQLRSKAKAELRAAEKCQQAAKDALRSQRSVSFGGAMGIDEMQHVRGTWNLEEAKRKRREAAGLEDKAKMLGGVDASNASYYRQKAAQLRSEAAILEREGTKLINASKK